MIAAFISFLVVYALYLFLVKVHNESKSTSAWFAVFMFIATTLLFSHLFVIKQTDVKEVPIKDIIEYYKSQPAKDNSQIIEDLHAEIQKGYTYARYSIVYVPSEDNIYLRSIYPRHVLNRLYSHRKTTMR